MRLKENKRDFDDSILKRESAFFNAYKAIGKRLETKRLTRAMRLDNMGRLCKMRILAAGVAQLVERNLAKVEVASSRLVSRSKFSLSPFVCSALSGLFVFAFDLAKALLVFRSVIGIFSGPPRGAFKCNSCPFQAVEKFELSPINPMSLR